MSLFLGIVVMALVLIRGFNKLLLWMDDKDWILLPNREAVQNADTRLLRAFLDAQAVVEPDKRKLVRHEAVRDELASEDDEGDGKPPRRRRR